MYTKSHNEDLLKEIDNQGGIFTAEEHAYVIKQEFAREFGSKESLLRWYFSNNANTDKLAALAFLIKHIHNNNFRNILSLGTGQCVLEYLLKCALPEGSKVIAADFDSFFIEKARLHFPQIIPVEFDFFKDDLQDLQNKLNIRFDLAVFFGAAYVMDDSRFVGIFRELREIGVKQIIDFHAGYIPYRKIPIIMLGRMKAYMMDKLRDIEIVNRIKPRSYKGKFHGYARSRGESRRLYKESGVNLVKEMSVGSYEYVAICNC